MVVKVCVLGLGYVGLPTGALLATKGMRVHGVDTNGALVEAINGGSFTSVEPDLDLLVKSAVGSGNLVASNVPAPADVFILAVPTPVLPDHSGADLAAIKAACEALAQHLVPRNLVILESTVPVGTTELMAEWIGNRRSDLTFSETDAAADDGNRIFLAHCPERVLPGHLMQELLENDRTVGGIDRPSAERARDFYATFVHGAITLTNARAAELSKLVENAYRDVNIAFANELSIICDDLDIDVWDLIQLANQHPRVNVLSPSSGVGGHCIAVDPWFIVASSPERAKLIRAAREVNDSKPGHVVAKVKRAVGDRKGAVIACLGLAFKPEVDDLRGSPALEIVECLAADQRLNLLVVE
ncbi:MAG: UDP-N-acetyl-D-mannosamine dehydrogenase, partial [Rhodospirillaceae bacterium]|nr:UDP-N-acetyl-D-mannosamine dehydrogenase [Rhodospirillaceae bacterium]